MELIYVFGIVPTEESTSSEVVWSCDKEMAAEQYDVQSTAAFRCSIVRPLALPDRVVICGSSVVTAWLYQRPELWEVLDERPAFEVARLLNTTDLDEFAALELLGLSEDDGDVMGEHECLPIGDLDCDVIDFCDGTLIRRPERRRGSDAKRLWSVEIYAGVATPGVAPTRS